MNFSITKPSSKWLLTYYEDPHNSHSFIHSLRRFI